MTVLAESVIAFSCCSPAFKAIVRTVDDVFARVDWAAASVLAVALVAFLAGLYYTPVACFTRRKNEARVQAV